MDKKYHKNTLKLALLLVCVSLFGCAILTVQKAEWVKSDMYDSIKGLPAYFHSSVEDYFSFGELKDYETTADPENALGIIPSFYLAHEDMLNNPYVSSDAGFHSMLKNSKGETIAEYQPYILFEKGINNIKKHDVRVLILGDEFIEEYSDLYSVTGNYKNDLSAYKQDALHVFDLGSGIVYGKNNNIYENNAIKVDGTCDDDFVYLNKLTWYNYTYHNTYGFVPKNNQTDKGKVDFEDWFDYEKGDSDFSGCSVSYLHHWNTDYNKEAEKLCEEGFELLKKDPDDRYEVFDEGLFTSTVRITDGITGFYDDGKADYVYSCVYVFHPIQIAVRELASVYVAVMVFATVAIIIMYLVMLNSYKKQKAAENNRRELTRGIAHELKTPLAITRGYIENWEYLPEEDKEEITHTMMEEMDHMNKMVTDLLDLSHMEAGIKPVQWEEVDLYSLTESILRRMRNIINERNLDVKIVPADIENTDDFVVSADLEMIRIAMSNFISNAVKYAEKEVVITLTQRNKKVSFEIENDGNAIDDEEIKKVWDEFYKSDSVNRSRIGSSGLGLAITKNIFILHNAEYGCDSENGKVRFFFEIKKKQ